VRETDVNVVVLSVIAPQLKKPVTTDLVDLGTPDRRLAACRREVELNRRLAPDVYLGISSVTDPVDPERDPARAPAVEHVVVMRRMPEDRRLSHLVRSGAPVDGALRALARTVAVFHAAARRDPEVTAEGSRDALVRGWAAVVAEVRATRVLAPHLVDAVERLAGRFLAGRAAIAQRCADDRIVDGHGDLVADDVFCLDDGRVLDCLEFDDRLRFVDGLDDAAFLAMDLERLGRPELATAWLDAYAEFSGDPPAALRHHYVARRASPRRRRRASAACRVTLAPWPTRTRTPTWRCATCAPARCGSCLSAACRAPARAPSPVGWPTGSAPCCCPATASAPSWPSTTISPRTARGGRPRPAPTRSTGSCCTARACCSNAVSRW
jgi:aminoglycoside phosphotransferase family enzyme